MTTLDQDALVCAVCGKTSEQAAISSTNVHGSPDLDLRPPEMQRSTMPYWVQTCPHCGYCAGDISRPFQHSSALIAGRLYQDRLKDPRYPELANRFRCQAMLAETSGERVKAGWLWVYAAWVCDDSSRASEALECRCRAVDHFQAAQAQGERFVEQLCAERMILSDLLRRSGRFAEAEIQVQAGLASPTDQETVKCLRYERCLIERRDHGAHTIAEALEEDV